MYVTDTYITQGCNKMAYLRPSSWAPVNSNIARARAGHDHRPLHPIYTYCHDHFPSYLMVLGCSLIIFSHNVYWTSPTFYCLQESRISNLSLRRLRNLMELSRSLKILCSIFIIVVIWLDFPYFILHTQLF